MEVSNQESMTFVVRKLYSLIGKRSRIALVMTLLLALIASSFEVATIANTLTFLDNVRETSEILSRARGAGGKVLDGFESKILFSGVLLIVVVNISAIARLASLWLNDKVAAKIANNLLADMYYGLMSKEYSDIKKMNTGAIITTLTAYHVDMVYTITNIIQLCTSLITVFSIMITLLAITPTLSLATVAIVGCTYGGIIYLVRNKVKRNSEIIAYANNAQIRHIQETFGDIKNIILGNAEAERTKQLKELDRMIRSRKIENSLIGSIPRFSIEALGISIIAIFSIAVIMRNDNAKPVIAIIGAFAVGILRLLPYIQNVYSRVVDLKINKTGTLYALAELPDKERFSAYSNTEMPTERKQMRFILKRVKLDDICFKYNERANYLHKNISLEIGHKGSLGVMGKSGSGKTTLIEILMTLMRPTSGRLLINNIDVWTNDDLRLEFRRNIYYVSQSVFFPDVAFGEIITGNKDPSKWNSYELKKCVELVGIEKIVSAENGGFERSMGENACMLSGGERQRISIAKALYRKSQLIILDEPTSSLDSYSEELVINAIKEMQRFSSTVIISHRIGPLELCDNVYDLSSDTGIYV